MSATSSRLLFSTPLRIVSLRSTLPKTANEQLSSRSLCLFDDFRKQSHIAPLSHSEQNNEFFHHQGRFIKDNGRELDGLADCEDFQALKSAFRANAEEFLKEQYPHGFADVKDGIREMDLYSWATVQHSSSIHPAHVHSDAMVCLLVVCVTIFIFFVVLKMPSEWS